MIDSNRPYRAWGLNNLKDLLALNDDLRPFDVIAIKKEIDYRRVNFIDRGIENGV